MTDIAPPVSRARYERERRARAEAEALLEAKSRELYEANQRLILETEAVRAARLALSRSGMLSKPSGSQIINSTTAAPNNGKYQLATPGTSRIHSGKITPTAAPTTGPRK